MRLWSLHPQYLDAKGLVALWREGLLARKALAGRTKGYRNHPQLERFKAARDPLRAVDDYLSVVWDESAARGYRFDRRKIRYRTPKVRLRVSRGQLAYELAHLKKKLRRRDPPRHRAMRGLTRPKPHPMFKVVPGKVASWEKL